MRNKPQDNRLKSRNGSIPRGMRSCDNCLGLFEVPPNVKGGKKKKRFCSKPCNDEYHRNKGVSVNKLKVQVKRWVREEMAAVRVEEQNGARV